MPFLEPCGFSLVGYDSKAVLVNTQRGITRKKVTGIFLNINAMPYKQAIALSHKKKQGSNTLPFYFVSHHVYLRMLKFAMMFSASFQRILESVAPKRTTIVGRLPTLVSNTTQLPASRM